MTRRQALTAALANFAYPAVLTAAKATPTLRFDSVEITILSDGHLVVPTPLLATNADQSRVHELIGSAMDTAGHTAGHIAVEITEGARSAVVVGDALSHPVISFAYPEWTPAADHHDRDQAVATRRALLARLAADRSRIIGYHLPFPGIGTVKRVGTAYRFEAAP